MNSRGFSLMELMIVLVIMSLVAGVTMPNLIKMYDSFQSKLEWESIAASVNALPLRAFQQQEELLIDSSSSPLIQLPEAWSFKVARPIKFKANGVCLGGELRFFYHQDLFRVVELGSPRCKIAGA